jgi:hypothetical protein
MQVPGIGPTGWKSKDDDDDDDDDWQGYSLCCAV